VLNADEIWTGIHRVEHATERATRVPAWQTEQRLFPRRGAIVLV